MDQNDQIEIIDSVEPLKKIFEEGRRYLKSHPRRRAMGGENWSKQIVLDKIEVKIPIIIGQPNFDERFSSADHCISKICSLDDPALYHEYPHLVFNGGTFESLHINGYKFPTPKQQEIPLISTDLKIEISDGEFLGPVRFSSSKLGHIKISGGIFHAPVCFERGLYGYVEISGGDFRGGLYFGQIIEFDKYSSTFLPPPDGTPSWASNEDGIFNELRFTGKILSSDIILQNVFITSDLLLSAVDSEFKITGITVKRTLEIRQGSYSISTSKADNLIIGSAKTPGKLLLDITLSTCNAIEFTNYNGRDSLVSFKNHQATSCKFDHFLNYGIIVFNFLNLKSNRKKFSELEPNKQAQSLNRKSFYQRMFNSVHQGGPAVAQEILNTYKAALTPSPALVEESSPSFIQFINSDVGKTSFLDSRLGDSKLHFKNSKLTEVFIAGTSIPRYEDTDGIIDSEQHRLALSQIRKIYENRGDNLLAHQYLSDELEVVRKEAKGWNKIHERVALTLNFWSNRHGLNWTPALKSLLILGSVFWFTVCFLFFDITDINTDSLLIFVKSISYFVQFLLPVHRLNLIEDFVSDVAGFKSESGIEWALSIANGIDTIWRLVSGYLFYQLIAAFRKHGKK